jgi:spore coat polysaccharide biosynthesis predicted glycosyltransferase SpsG/RimJ/RimL family protein N-acetyltransferase
MRRLVVRADAGREIGSGHLARGLALCQAWCDAGGDAVLASHEPPSLWRERYGAEGVPVVEPASLAVGPGDFVALDGYHLDRADPARHRAAGARVLIIDDHGSWGTYEADVVLDANLGATADAYVSRSAGSELLLGTRYALLRREFGDARRAGSGDVAAPSTVAEVLVSVGGAPRQDAVDLAQQTLARVDAVFAHVHWLHDVVDVPAVMARSQLALSAAGTTCWELCCLGVPAVVFAVAPNQEPVGGALAAAGAAVYAGRYEDLGAERLAADLSKLASNAGLRAAMTETGRNLVDGRGAARLVTRLRAFDLGLRRVAADDRERLWTWANDPTTRRQSFDSRPIGWDEHVEWFEHRMRDANSVMFIAEDDHQHPIGQIRFDVEGRRAVVSVSVAPEARGRGWGGVVIASGTRRLLRDVPAVEEVIGRIRPENTGSIAAFDRAGFARVDTGSAPTWVEYARRRDGV